MPAIKTMQVATGVHWVEIPAADLRILCGCPADCVKHLMKKGLIVSEDQGGTPSETGPNAIVLSDSLIQGGAFSNLAEFPVLQMLYRQGMLLPGHPNNTGRKPLLIGSETQVQAQLRYIHRGNYGLVTEEELRQAGMNAQRARREMRMKLRFAFGEIKPSDELLDTLAVGSEPVEIRGGAGIRRRAHNVFEFSHGGETAIVDLNLKRGESYPSPYPLAYSQAGRNYFSVIHSGDGDGWDINRPAMASIVVFQGRIYLIDAGPNIEHSLTALGIGVNEVKGVFHTHAHDDHFCGLTTLMQTDHRLEHYATRAVRASVAAKWSALMSRPEKEFSQYFNPIDLAEGRWNDIDGLEVKPVFSPHPVETTVLFFRAKGEGGYRTYAHLADLASRRVLGSFVTDDGEAPGISQELYDEVWRQYLAKADIKKIDKGGGLIHGEAEDFRDDPSARIILSHTALPLTAEEKEIGSEAVFGTEDVLIEGKQDFVRSTAYMYLTEYLPGARRHELRMLMNGDMETVSPGTILLKRGERLPHLGLIVTGGVEVIDSTRGVISRLNAGGLVGESSAMDNAPARFTFRALTYVRVLRLHRRLVSDVLRKNKLGEYFAATRSLRKFFLGTWLFGDAVSPAVLNRMATAMATVDFDPGEVLAWGRKPALYVLTEGEASIRYEGREIETIGPGDFFGEGFTLFDTPCITQAVSLSKVRLHVIDAETLRSIPAVRWKLYETFRRRMEAVVEPTATRESLFEWRPEYSTGVDRQDEDHKRLLSSAAQVYAALSEKRPQDEVDEHLRRFADCTGEHFARELAMYRKEGFPEYEHHAGLHAALMADLRRKVERIRQGTSDMDLEFLVFFKSWIIDHIMTEDRKFGTMMAFRSS